MNYIEYKISELIINNSNDGIAGFLSKHFYLNSGSQRAVSSCYYAIDNSLNDLRSYAGDRLYDFGVDELKGPIDLDNLQTDLHNAYDEICSISGDLTNEDAFCKLIRNSRCIFNVERIIKKCIWVDWDRNLIKLDNYDIPDIVHNPKFIIRAIEPHWNSFNTYNAFAASLFTAGKQWYNDRKIAIAYACDENSLVCMDYEDVPFIYDYANSVDFRDLVYDLSYGLVVRFFTDKNGRFSLFDHFSKHSNKFGGTIVLKTSAKPQAVFFRDDGESVLYASALANVMGLPLYKVVGEELHKQVLAV